MTATTISHLLVRFFYTQQLTDMVELKIDIKLIKDLNVSPKNLLKKHKGRFIVYKESHIHPVMFDKRKDVCVLSDYPEFKHYSIKQHPDKHFSEDLFFEDCLSLREIIKQDIGYVDQNTLLYNMVCVLVNNYYVFLNSFTVDDLISMLGRVVNYEGEVKTSGKKFKFNTDNREMFNEVKNSFRPINKIRKIIKEEVYSTYDKNISIEENLKNIVKRGGPKGKKYLIKWLNENNIEYFSDNDTKEKRVMELKKEGKSVREISKIMKDEGFEKVSFKTIARILNKIDENFEIVEERLDEHEDKFDKIFEVLEKHNKVLMELYNKLK